MTLHPASLLLGWLVFALTLQWLALPSLLGMAAIALPAAFFLARRRSQLLLRRARWLLLSIAVLFSLATPGVALPEPFNVPGLTHEGCLLAMTHVLRLTVLLALLALLLEHLAIPQLIAGLYLLLAPLGETFGRSRIALRLLLVLEYVEQDEIPRHWRDWLAPQVAGRDYPPLELTLAPLAGVDYLAMAMVALAVVLPFISINP